jgi:putative ABC transport system permease protein
VRRPPALARAIVRQLLRGPDREFLLADLDEQYTSLGWYLAEGAHAAWTRRSPEQYLSTTLSTKGRLTMGFWQDIRYAARSLFKQRGFTLVALITLALGIGANTAVFSVIRHVLLAPLPYRDAPNVAVVWSKWVGFDKTWVSDAETIDYQTRITSFSSAGAWDVGQANLTGDGDPIRIGFAFVTPRLFDDVLGVAPAMGRTFTAAEAEPPAPTVAIISHALWQQRYDGKPTVIGSKISVNGIAREVIGVMPKDFQLPTDYVIDAEEPTKLWLPLKLDPENRGSHGLHAAARLAPGATVARANAELATHAESLVKDGKIPAAMKFAPYAVSAPDEAFAEVRPALLLVFGAVAFLLLIACVNVANLLLVRADARAREMALRTALGANRWRLVRQLVTEGAVLAVVAAVAGVGLAAAALKALTATAGTSLPRVASVTLDGQVLAFSAAITLITLFLFSLIPAIRAARVELVDSLKDGSQNSSAGAGRQRLRGALVITEMALAVVMLAGAGLMLRNLWALQKIDLGFNPDRVLTMRLALPATQYDTPEKAVAFFQQVLANVRAVPGVERAGLLRLLPLAAPIGDSGLMVEGYQPPPGTGAPGDWQIASAGGPEALGERLVAGRWLEDADVAGRENVGLINEAMAAKYWAGRQALGGRYKHGGPDRPWVTVVGIVANVRHNGIEGEIKPKFYRPFAQWHVNSSNPSRNQTLVVKTTGDPMALASTVRAEIRKLDANLPIAAVRSMQSVVDQSIATPRLAGWLLGLFSSLALGLAAVGIYGVLSYVVSQRRQEIGIRLAIGADRRRVLAMILRSGLGLSLAGVVIGIVCAAGLARAIASMLHQVAPLDPVTFVAVPIVLLTVSAFACLLPALKATRVSPVSALRAE